MSFSSSDILRLTGVTSRQHLRLHKQALTNHPADGCTLIDLIRITCIKRLLDIGLSPKDCASAAELLREDYRPTWLTVSGAGGARYVRSLRAACELADWAVVLNVAAVVRELIQAVRKG